MLDGDCHFIWDIYSYAFNDTKIKFLLHSELNLYLFIALEVPQDCFTICAVYRDIVILIKEAEGKSSKQSNSWCNQLYCWHCCLTKRIGAIDECSLKNIWKWWSVLSDYGDYRCDTVIKGILFSIPERLWSGKVLPKVIEKQWSFLGNLLWRIFPKCTYYK